MSEIVKDERVSPEDIEAVEKILANVRDESTHVITMGDGVAYSALARVLALAKANARPPGTFAPPKSVPTPPRRWRVRVVYVEPCSNERDVFVIADTVQEAAENAKNHACWYDCGEPQEFEPQGRARRATAGGADVVPGGDASAIS